MVSGFIKRSTKALTPELEWIRAVTGDGSAHPRKRKQQDGVARVGEAGIMNVRHPMLSRRWESTPWHQYQR